jgi:predicted ester cyclase
LIDGERIAQSATFGGTDVGGFMGLPPSGKHVRVPAVFLFRMANCEIVWMRSVYDFTLMLVQVGVLKIKAS